MTLPSDLSDALALTLDDLSRALLRARPRADATLASGAAGLALAHAALEAALPGRGHRDVAGRCLERAVGALGKTPLSPAAVDGYVGVLWTAVHLAPADAEPICARADVALRRALRRRGPDAHDLFQGAAGVLRYALDRPGGAPQLATVALDQIERTLHAAGPSWRSTVLYPRRHIARRLGMAHGAAGVLTSLAACAGHGREADRAEALAARAAPWLAEAAAGDDPPDAWSESGGALRGRAAYCIGVVGAAVGLVRAGAAFGRRDWVEAGLTLGRRAADDRRGDAAVVDGGICHGAAGLALVFHRLAQSASDPVPFVAARDRWLRALLALRRRGRGVAGFVAIERDPGALRRVADPGLLTGAAGVALVTTTVLGHDSGWDTLLGTAR